MKYLTTLLIALYFVAGAQIEPKNCKHSKKCETIQEHRRKLTLITPNGFQL